MGNDKTIKLSDYKQEIIKALTEKQPIKPSTGSQFTIVGFSRIAISDEISSVINIGGKGIPVVIVLDGTTGIIHQIALFALLPNLKDKL